MAEGESRLNCEPPSAPLVLAVAHGRQPSAPPEFFLINPHRPTHARQAPTDVDRQVACVFRVDAERGRHDAHVARPINRVFDRNRLCAVPHLCASASASATARRKMGNKQTVHIEIINKMCRVGSMYDISSIDGLVDTLGGPKAVAEWLGISATAVCFWKSRGHIPPGWHIRLYAEVTRRGLTVDPAVFGLAPEDLVPLGGLMGLARSGAVAAV